MYRHNIRDTHFVTIRFSEGGLWPWHGVYSKSGAQWDPAGLTIGEMLDGSLGRWVESGMIVLEAKWGPHFWCNSRIVVAKLSRIYCRKNRSILVLKYFNCSMQRCWDETFISKDCVFWNLPVVGMLLGIFSHFRIIHLHLGKKTIYWDQPCEMLLRFWKGLRVAK